MSFPSLEKWLSIIEPSDYKRITQSKDYLDKRYKYYKDKYEIIKRFNPKSICEIGVRYGYSAYSFLSAHPDTSYTGYDIINGGHGGAKDIDTFTYVKKLLSTFSKADINLVHQNTQELEFLNDNYDFIHVDGDHSYVGCYNDLVLALNSINTEGVILVDDYTDGIEVGNSTRDFIKDNQVFIEYTEYVDTLHGDMIIKIKK